MPPPTALLETFQGVANDDRDPDNILFGTKPPPFFNEVFMSSRAVFLWALTLTLLGTLSVAADESPLFPFTISQDSPQNAVNASRWFDAPAGKNGFVRVKNGQFFNDKGRVLFWGTNLCFDNCFPSHEEAEQLAARIARLGFNAVRLHHMDARDIWGGNKAKTLTTIDPEQREKLDYLIFQLKKNGVYVNINLHVSRWFDDRDGFTGKDQRPKYDKGLDNFYRPFIELQKKYARDLLTHVNPYTKTSSIDEPAVCMVEINNENSIVRQWLSGTVLADMPDPYAAEYRRLWNEFLKRQYNTTAATKKAWGCQDVPLGNELLASDAKGYWKVNTGGVAQAKLSQSGKEIKLNVETVGKDSWIPQIVSNNFAVDKDQMYTVSFRIKSSTKQSISTGVKMNHEPWTNLGLSQKIDATTDWQTHTFQFVCSASDTQTRIDFSGFAPGTYEIVDVSVKPGGVSGPRADETIETGTVPVLSKGGGRYPKAAIDDFCKFLIETETKYWLEMDRFLKDELKVRQPISGTQLDYGSTIAQAQLDYCDIHAYWNHPTFPGVQWDRKNWYIRNRALVNSPDHSIFGHLATRRVHGKPYTVSEYDHPFPNQYGAEGLPMLAAFGRFQNWDGVYQFDYGKPTIKETTAMGSFFSIYANMVQLAHNPACYAMFCRGDVAEGKTTISADWTPTTELTILQAQKSTRFDFKGLGLDERLALLYPTSLEIKSNSTSSSKRYPVIPDDATTFRSETKELQWNMSEKDKGFFLLDTANTKLFTGFAKDGDVFGFNDVDLRIGQTRLGWTTISMVSLDGNGFGQKSGGKETRILVAATGLMENTGMKFQHLDGDKITLADQWGKGPILCEGIPATLTLTGVDLKKVRCYPLDEKGNRKDAIGVKQADKGVVVELSPEHKTIWYEIVVMP